MAVPKKKLSKTRRGNRRSHLALKKTNLTNCPKCNEKVLPHHVCDTCGTYKGDQVIDFSKKDKKEQSKKRS